MDITLNPMKMEIMDKKTTKQWPTHQRKAFTISPKIDYFTKSPEMFAKSFFDGFKELYLFPKDVIIFPQFAVFRRNSL